MDTSDATLWRLWLFLGLLAALSLAERLRPGPNPSQRRAQRWPAHLALVVLDTALARLLLLLPVSVSAPYAAVLALMATFFMIELNEGPFWAATMRVARSDTGAATGVLNTGGNFAGMVSAPIIGALSGAGNWNATFVIGAVFAFVGAACWLAIDPDRRVVSAV